MTSSEIGTKVSDRALRWLLTCLCLVAFAAGHAGIKEGEELTASAVFAEAPLEALDMIRPSTRLDMLDYYTQADSIMTALNALGGECRLVTVTPDYLKVSVTPISTLEIKVLPVGKKRIVMTLYTVGEDSAAMDTEVRFFDSQLKPLDVSKYFKAPSLSDFFSLKGSGVTESELEEKVPFAAIVYRIGPGDIPMSATLTTQQVISEEDRDLIKSILTPTLTAEWKGGYRFK